MHEDRDASRAKAAAVERAGWVVEAAFQLLEARGPEAVTVHDIAERAGVGVGSLYRYFAGKEAVVAAVFQREAERALEALDGRETALAGRSLHETLQRALVVSVERHARLRRLHPGYAAAHAEALGVATASEAGRARVRHLAERLLLHHRAELRADLELESALFLLAEGLTALVHAALRHRPELLDGPGFALALADLAHRYLARDGAAARRAAESGWSGEVSTRMRRVPPEREPRCGGE